MISLGADLDIEAATAESGMIGLSLICQISNVVAPYPTVLNRGAALKDDRPSPIDCLPSLPCRSYRDISDSITILSVLAAASAAATATTYGKPKTTAQCCAFGCTQDF